jgi:hypothetical protein
VQDDPESRSFLLYGIRSACCCPRLTAGCTQSKPRQKSAALKKRETIFASRFGFAGWITFIPRSSFLEPKQINQKKIMKSNNRHLVALSCAALLGSAASSQAALTIGDIVSVSFGQTGSITVSGAAFIGAGGDTWNNLNASSGSNVSALGTVGLNKVNGASSGVGLSVSTGNFNGSGTSSTNLDVYEGNIYLDGDNVFGPSGPATITLTGLGVGNFVDLYFYIGAGHTSGEGGTITIGSTSYTATDANGVEEAYTLGTNYVKFDDVETDGSGNIVATWSVASGQRFSSLAGIQIEAVPEPSAALLGGLGLLALLRRRR